MNTLLTLVPAPVVTLPGRKDSMTAYVADRAPALAPFSFFRSQSA